MEDFQTLVNSVLFAMVIISLMLQIVFNWFLWNEMKELKHVFKSKNRH